MIVSGSRKYSGEWSQEGASSESYPDVHESLQDAPHTQVSRHTRTTSQVISSTYAPPSEFGLPAYNKQPNCVAAEQPILNPGYDALLYRRLYNSPPPPLPPKAARARRNSDSAVSDCSPPSPISPATPGSPGEAILADRLAAHTAAIPRYTLYLSFYASILILFHIKVVLETLKKVRRLITVHLRNRAILV